MANRSRDRAERPSHPPLWLVEGLDIVSRKWVLLAVVTAVVIVLGSIAALVLPGVVPPTPAVGAAIGLAGLLLGLAAAVATDATDLVVRGPRHVAAAGGELVAVLPRDPSVAAAGPLAAAVLEVREPGVPLLLAFATASRDARRSSAWTDAIARSLVSDGVGVLRVDLASGRSEHPGLVEVVRDDTRLADAVTFEPGVKLAQLSAGRDHADALAALTELPGRLPRDLDIMLVSLPTAASRSVVAAAAALDHVLIIVERDRTSRVDLIASLDALEAAGTHAQVVLLDTSTAMRLAPPVEVDPEAEAERRRTISSTVGTSPVVVPGSDGEPLPVPEDEATSELEEELVGDGPVPEDDEAVAELEDEDLADEFADEFGDEDEDEFADELGDVDEDAPADQAVVARSDDEIPSTEEEDREGLALGGPLAAGVAGAGVAAGLGAVMADGEEDLDGAPEASATDGAETEATESDDGAPDDGAPDDAVDVSDEPIAEEPEPADAEAAPEAAAESPAAPEVDTDLAARDGAATEAEIESEGGGEQRDLELLEAAAAAAAMSIADAEQEPFDQEFDEDVEPRDLEDELPQPGEPLVEELVELQAGEEHPAEATEAAEGPAAPVDEPEPSEPTAAELADEEQQVTGSAEVIEAAHDEDQPVADVADAAEVEQDDPTDRLAPVPVSDTPMLDPFDAADQDLLRTTAQLAILSDDLAVRGRAEAEDGEPSEPGSDGSEDTVDDDVDDADDTGRDDRA